MKAKLIALLILAAIPYSAANANCLYGNQWYPVGYVLTLSNGSHIQCQANGTWIAVR